MRYILATLALAALAQARPDDSYGAPAAPSYSAPAPSYSAPAPSYSAPAESYDAPAETYGAPAPSYGAPSYEAAPAFDLKIILIPIIALIGLFLLFPTYVSLTTVRRKRDVAETDLATDVVNRIQDMYMAVIESEECMERIACQVGAVAKDAGLSTPLASSAMFLAPKKYAKYAKQFALPSECSKIKCGNLL
jgi:hypothetical protein